MAEDVSEEAVATALGLLVDLSRVLLQTAEREAAGRTHSRQRCACCDGLH